MARRKVDGKEGRAEKERKETREESNRRANGRVDVKILQ